MKTLFLFLIFFQNFAVAQELFCEFKVQGAYPFLSTLVPMIDEKTLGDEVTVDRYHGAKIAYLLRVMDLMPGDLFKFSIADGSATEVYVTVFEKAGQPEGSLQGQITNPEAPTYIKNVPGLCWIQ